MTKGKLKRKNILLYYILLLFFYQQIYNKLKIRKYISFFRHEELTRHKRSHTKEKIYICPQCSKGFTRSDYLTKHIDMHKRRALVSKLLFSAKIIFKFC